ncbi:MAG: hypothetical protein PHS64_06295, partial [Candidatus Omnitrophica bacterium]|nr:hypothetical protein [Candidatus Omnitrophota bacterium]
LRPYLDTQEQTGLWLEVITGDASHIEELKKGAFFEQGKVNHPLKDERSVAEALEFIQRQDADPAFRLLSKKIYSDSRALIFDLLRERTEERKTALIKSLFVDAELSFAEANLKLLFFEALYDRPEFSPVEFKKRRYLVFSTVCSAVLKRPDAQEMAAFLETLLTGPTVIAEGALMIRSFLNIYSLVFSESIKVTTVIGVYGGHIAVLKSNDHPAAEDAFRQKIRQLEELFSLNSAITWELIYVQDGDDRKFKDGLTSRKTCDIIADILAEEYPGYQDRIQIIEADAKLKESLQGIQGSALTLGMRRALDNGADFIVYTNLDLDTHCGLEGLILQPVMTGQADMVCGSNRTKQSVLYLERLYFWFSVVLNAFVRAVLPVGGIRDTHNAFKAFSRETLEAVLPVDKDYAFEKDSDYFFTFTDLLISKANLLGKKVQEVGVCMHHSEALSTVSPSYALEFYRRVWGQREQLRRWQVGAYELSVTAVARKGGRDVFGIDPAYKPEAPEAIGLMQQSISRIRDIKTPLKVGTVLVLYRPEDHARFDYLKERIDQLDRLYSMNSLVDWELIVVHEESYADTPAFAWKGLLENEYREFFGQGRIKFYELPVDGEGRFGYGVVYGMYKAVEDGCDYVVYCHAKPAIDLTLEGIVLGASLDSDATAIGSKMVPGTLLKRGVKRKAGSSVYRRIRNIILSRISYLKDTQVPLKCYPASALKKILPYDSASGFDRDFDYWPSFDTHLLVRIHDLGLPIIEVPVIYLWDRREPSRFIEAAHMVIGMFRQRKIFIDKTKASLELIGEGKTFKVYETCSLPGKVIKLPRHGIARKTASDTGAVVSGKARALTGALFAWIISFDSGFKAVKTIQNNSALRSAILSLANIFRREQPWTAADLDPGLSGLSGNTVFIPDFSGVIKGRLYKGPAFIQDKAQSSLETLLRAAAKNGDLEEAELMIDAAFALQKSLWNRGYFNTDVYNVLMDTARDASGNWFLMDCNDLTVDRGEALRVIAKAQRHPFHIFTLLTIKEFSPQIARYYEKVFASIFAPESLEDNWRKDAQDGGRRFILREETRSNPVPIADLVAEVQHRGDNVIFISNAGKAMRQGLLGIVSGSKGDVRVMGQRLKEIAYNSALAFAEK